MPGGKKNKAAARQAKNEAGSVVATPEKPEKAAQAEPVTPVQETKKQQVVEEPQPTSGAAEPETKPQTQQIKSLANTVLGLVFIPVVLFLQLQDFTKKWVAAKLTTIITRIQTTIQSILAKLREIKAKIFGLVDRTVVQPVLKVVKPIFDSVVARVTKVVTTVVNFFAPTYNWIKAKLTAVITYLRGWFTFFLGTAKQVFTTINQRVLTPALTFARGILSAAVAVAGQLWTRFVALATSVQTFVRQIVGTVRSVWIDLVRPNVQKLRTRVETRVLSVYATVSGFFVKSGALDIIKRAVAQAWIFVEAVRQRVFATTAIALTLAQRWFVVGTNQASKAYDNAWAFIAKLPFVQSLRT